jgi:hypothetical protein
MRALEADLKRRREKFYRIGHVVTAATGPRIKYTGRLQL